MNIMQINTVQPLIVHRIEKYNGSGLMSKQRKAPTPDSFTEEDCKKGYCRGRFINYIV